MSRSVYLDHLAATPLLPEVFEAMRPFLLESFGNPSSFHHFGLQARDALAHARGQIAALINAESPDDIIFTSGGTESINLAVKGAAWANQRQGNQIIITETEHPAVLRSAEFLSGQGFVITLVKVDSQGRIDPEAIRAAITEQTILISVHHANHEIGTIQPVEQIGQIAAERGIVLHVDATTSAGWLPVDVQKLGVSLLSLSPHRFYGPKGCGALYRHRRSRLTALQHGGEQEGKRRAGTENIPAIVGGGAAAEIARRELSQRISHVSAIQQRLAEGLECRIPYLRFNGPAPGPERISTNLNCSIEFIEGEAMVLAADMAGISLASSSSCLGKASRISPVLAAIGLEPSLAKGSILMTLGAQNTGDEIDHTIDTLAGITAKLRAMSPAWDDFERGRTESVICPRNFSPDPVSN